jgi:hypothetical protein
MRRYAISFDTLRGASGLLSSRPFALVLIAICFCFRFFLFVVPPLLLQSVDVSLPFD